MPIFCVRRLNHCTVYNIRVPHDDIFYSGRKHLAAAPNNDPLYPALYKKISVAADRAEVSGVEPYAAVGVLLNYSGVSSGAWKYSFIIVGD